MASAGEGRSPFGTRPISPRLGVRLRGGDRCPRRHPQSDLRVYARRMTTRVPATVLCKVPRTSQRAQYSASTKRALIDVAGKLFTEQGYAGMSLARSWPAPASPRAPSTTTSVGSRRSSSRCSKTSR
jgi:hypothetical protein